jgi:hypothetical protein
MGSSVDSFPDRVPVTEHTLLERFTTEKEGE